MAPGPDAISRYSALPVRAIDRVSVIGPGKANGKPRPAAGHRCDADPKRMNGCPLSAAAPACSGLDNYAKTKEGVIYQIEYDKFVYDEGYIARAYGSAPREAMSHLRLGYLVGAIGHAPRSLLDVGYGSGDFLKVALTLVPDVCGYDIPPVYPLRDITLLDSPFARTFEVVTFFDSLEHFEDINVVRLLQTQYVCISLPWCHNFSDEWFENWKHRKPNEHLWHFNAESLIRFMQTMGFDVINFCNIEGTIRKSNGDWDNILSAVFKRR